MVKTIVREHHWTPKTLSEMYIDDVDYQGLEYWYNDISEVIDDTKKRMKK